MTNARDTHRKRNLSRDYVSLVITEKIKLLLEPDTQKANSIFFFIFCSIPMTATSHHTLQLAHAAGMLSALVHNEWAATESRTWEEVKNYLERYEISLPVAKETSCLLWEDSRAASFTHPYYQHYFTCKQTKENFKQSLTCYINSYTLYNYHQWVKIKISFQLRRDAVLVGSLGKQ